MHDDTHPLGPEFFENEWPDPKELQPELPPVPDFNLDHLPVALRPLVEEVSEGMQLPYDFPACASIVALAGCVGHRAVVLPKHLDSSWREICNLWGANIGSPGLMKTPVLRLVMRPLESIEREWREAQQADEETHEQLKQQIKLEMEVYESVAKTKIRTGQPLPPRPDDKLWAPNERRLLISDCTFEKLHEIQSANPAGILQVRDELTGFFTGLERDGRQGEREYWLQCWSGDSGFNVDRIGRGSIYVPYVCASLFGNCVPNKLRYYLTSILSGAATDDGLIQRFQAMCWPDTPRGWKHRQNKQQHGGHQCRAGISVACEAKWKVPT
jgi:putative DNA primase/helicase